MSTSTHRTPSGNFKGNSNGKNPGRFRANQPGTHTLAERGSDFYPTLRIAVENPLGALRTRPDHTPLFKILHDRTFDQSSLQARRTVGAAGAWGNPRALNPIRSDCTGLSGGRAGRGA